MLPECGVYITIEHNGDVYSCDFFVEPEWKLGNVTEMFPGEIFYSEKQDHFGKKKLDLAEACKSCECKQLCWGGCLKNRVINNRDYLCEAFKMFHNYSKEKFIQF